MCQIPLRANIPLSDTPKIGGLPCVYQDSNRQVKVQQVLYLQWFLRRCEIALDGSE